LTQDEWKKLQKKFQMRKESAQNEIKKLMKSIENKRKELDTVFFNNQKEIEDLRLDEGVYDWNEFITTVHWPLIDTDSIIGDLQQFSIHLQEKNIIRYGQYFEDIKESREIQKYAINALEYFKKYVKKNPSLLKMQNEADWKKFDEEFKTHKCTLEDKERI